MGGKKLYRRTPHDLGGRGSRTTLYKKLGKAISLGGMAFCFRMLFLLTKKKGARNR